MKKGLKIGIGMVIAGALMIFLFMYMRGGTVLNKDKKLRAIFPSVEGLIEASPVLLKGFQVGEVKAIEPHRLDSNKYELMVTFLMTTAIKIPEKSHVRIISSDLLGTKAVELLLSEEQNPMADNEVLTGITEESFSDKINRELAPLKDKVSNVASSFDSVSAIFKEIKATNMEQNLKASLNSIKKSITALKLTTGKVDTIMGPDNSAIKGIMLRVNSISANLTKNQSAINRMTGNFNNIVDPDAKKMAASVMNEVNAAIAEAKGAVAWINAGKGTTGKAIHTKQIQDNLDKANKDLDILLKEMVRNPDRFFKVSVFAPKKIEVHPDSI